MSLGAISGYNGRGASEVAGSIRQEAVGVVCDVAQGRRLAAPNSRECRRPTSPKQPTLVQTLVSTFASTLVANDPPTDPKH